MTSKRRIEYGTIDILPEDALSPRSVKVRITTLVDEDILRKLKVFAEKKGAGYQTVLNALLRSFFDRPERMTPVRSLSEERVRRIVQEELRKKA